jgi:hypothetical protein
LPEHLNVPWTVRDLVVFVAAWFGIQVVVMLALSLLGPVWSPAAHFVDLATKGDIGASFALDLLDAAVGFGLVALYLRRYRVGWSAVGWRRVNVVRALAYLGLILVAFIVLSNIALDLVSVLVPSFNPNQAQQNDFVGAAHTHQSLALVALVLLPPVLEETIFRGFLFPALAKKWGPVWGAVVSSAVFGIAHAQANISIYTFVLGLMLCYMYLKLKSIFPGMALHMLNNYLAFIALSGK